jgi:hypothetical protein
MTLEPQIDPTDRRVKKQHKGINRGNTRAYSVARTGTATSRESPQRDQTSTGNRVRDEEVALALWRAGRGGDGRLAMPSHGPLTSTLTTTRCRRVGRARTTPDR